MTSVGSRKKGLAPLGFVLWLAVSAGAHVGDRVYPVAYLSDEILEKIDLRDGLVEEWYEVVGEPSMTMLDFTSLDPGNSPDPSDLDFRIWLAWHDDPARFYVAFVASDDIYKNDHDYNAESWGLDFIWYYNDCISVVIDGDHGGGEGEDNNVSVEEAAEVRNRSQGYFAIARTPEGPILDEVFTRYMTGEFAWTVLPPYGDGGGGVVGENPTISVIELYVTPFDRWAFDDIEGSVVSHLAPNQTIGFGVMVYEEDPPERVGGALGRSLATCRPLQWHLRHASRRLPRRPAAPRTGCRAWERQRGRVGFLGADQGLPGDGVRRKEDDLRSH